MACAEMTLEPGYKTPGGKDLSISPLNGSVDSTHRSPFEKIGSRVEPTSNDVSDRVGTSRCYIDLMNRKASSTKVSQPYFVEEQQYHITTHISTQSSCQQTQDQRRAANMFFKRLYPWASPLPKGFMRRISSMSTSHSTAWPL